LPKYYYNPVKEVVQATYLEHTGVDLFADADYKINVQLVVDAKDEAESEKMRVSITDIRMWELDKVED
jgi:hypothetical protein